MVDPKFAPPKRDPSIETVWPSPVKTTTESAHPIIGKWIDIHGTDVMEFFPDGSLKMSSKLVDMKGMGDGSFRIITPSKMHVDLPTIPKLANRDTYWDFDLTEGNRRLVIVMRNMSSDGGPETTYWRRR